MKYLIIINLLLNFFITGMFVRDISEADSPIRRIGGFLLFLLFGAEILLIGEIKTWLSEFAAWFEMITQFRFYFQFKRGEFNNITKDHIDVLEFKYWSTKNKNQPLKYGRYLRAIEKIFIRNNHIPKQKTYGQA